MSEEKLSVRLEAAAHVRLGCVGTTDSPLYKLLTEAAQLARRVEEAPVCEITAGYNGPCAAFGCSGADDKAMSAMVSQRVRLVRE